MSGLLVRGLEKSFGSHAVLRGVDLEVPAGSFTAILGSSGSGKTTLLRLVAGFERPERGTIEVGGRLVEGSGRHVPSARRRIGYVPQEGSLFPHLSVEANVGFGLARSRRRQAVAELLEMVGLTELSRRYPHQLSGGQQQRVALARALAVEPEVVLLDEPFAGLDAQLRATVRSEVRQILADAGATALLVTHDQDEALSLADLVAVLRQGTIAQCATARHLYRWPVDPEMARFVGEANILAGRVTGEGVDTVLGTLAVQSECPALERGSAVQVLVRPEQIAVDHVGGRGLAGSVVGSGYHGHDALSSVRLGEHPDQVLVTRTQGPSQPEVGAPVALWVKGAVMVWPAPGPEGEAPAQGSLGPQGASGRPQGNGVRTPAVPVVGAGGGTTPT